MVLGKTRINCALSLGLFSSKCSSSCVSCTVRVCEALEKWGVRRPQPVSLRFITSEVFTHPSKWSIQVFHHIHGRRCMKSSSWANLQTFVKERLALRSSVNSIVVLMPPVKLPYKCTSGRMVNHSHEHTAKCCGKHSQKSRGCYSCKVFLDFLSWQCEFSRRVCVCHYSRWGAPDRGSPYSHAVVDESSAFILRSTFVSLSKTWTQNSWNTV